MMAKYFKLTDEQKIFIIKGRVYGKKYFMVETLQREIKKDGRYL